MVRRNPAFRIAIGGLAVAVMLCLVAAVSLVSSMPTEEVAVVAAVPQSTPPILVATAGEVGSLLHDPARKPVPDPPEDHSADHPSPKLNQITELDSASESWTGEPVDEQSATDPHLSSQDLPSDQIVPNSSSNPAKSPIQMASIEYEITQLKGQVNELSRSQLESQLAEIRHAEQLLSTHQSTRMIESLQRDVEELKSERRSVSRTPDSLPDQGEPISTDPLTMGNEDVPAPPSEVDASSESTVVSDSPGEEPRIAATTSNAETQGQNSASRSPVSEEQHSIVHASRAKVRFLESPDVAGQFDVDADEATLQEFLATLGPVAGWNLVSGPELKGTVTCRWKSVELQQALTQLLKVHGWQIRQDGNFAIVEPTPRSQSAKSTDVDSSIEADDHSTDAITLQLDPDTSGILSLDGDADGSPEDSLRTRGTLAFRSQFKTGSESFRSGHHQISYGSRSTGTPRTGRIVMKDYPELMAQGTVPAGPKIETPQWVDIEATILEIRQASESSRGVFRHALTVSGRGPCPRCGEVHHGTVEVGHTAEGWTDLGEGISSGVCLMTPELIVARLQQTAAASVTATPRVKVLNRQLAEIGLTEQQGFRRHIVRGTEQTQTMDFLEGGVQFSLRPTVEIDGSVRLDVRPSFDQASTAATSDSKSKQPLEFGTTLRVPPGSSVVLGGLFFENAQPAKSATQNDAADSKDRPQELYEVIVLITLRPATGETPLTRSQSPVDSSPLTSTPQLLQGPVLPAE